VSPDDWRQPRSWGSRLSPTEIGQAAQQVRVLQQQPTSPPCTIGAMASRQRTAHGDWNLLALCLHAAGAPAVAQQMCICGSLDGSRWWQMALLGLTDSLAARGNDSAPCAGASNCCLLRRRQVVRHCRAPPSAATPSQVCHASHRADVAVLQYLLSPHQYTSRPAPVLQYPLSPQFLADHVRLEDVRLYLRDLLRYM
jgi:hypothetical protein